MIEEMLMEFELEKENPVDMPLDILQEKIDDLYIDIAECEDRKKTRSLKKEYRELITIYNDRVKYKAYNENI